jgi:hypothetical protein
MYVLERVRNQRYYYTTLYNTILPEKPLYCYGHTLDVAASSDCCATTLHMHSLAVVVLSAAHCCPVMLP